MQGLMEHSAEAGASPGTGENETWNTVAADCTIGRRPVVQRPTPLLAQKQTGLCIAAVGLASGAAAILVPAAATIALPLLIGGCGALLAGIICLLRSVTHPRSNQLDRVLEFVDDEFRSDVFDHDTPHVRRDDSVPVTNRWESLLSADDERLLQCIEQRLAPHAAGGNDDRWRNVVDSLSDGLCLTDAEGLVLEATPAFRALTRVAENIEIEGRPIWEVLSEVSPNDAEGIAERIAQGSQTFVTELFCGDTLNDGVLRLSRTPLRSRTPPRNDHGRQTGVWCLRDITQHKLSEEARNEFVVTATHELRTPLTNLKAYAETLALEDDIEVEQQKEFCNIINAEATRLSRFIDELLNLSRMDGGEMSITRNETDMGRLVTETVDHVRPQFEHKGQRFDLSLPPKFPRMSVDKDSVAAALVNLLGNACKYTPEGGSVRMEVEWLEDRLVFHVEDSGIGISAEETRQIFDRFFRSGDPRVREIEGTGLGLAYVREVARLHGGQLTVHSELDSGSKFSLTLPL